MIRHVTHHFPPVIDEKSKILILGSVPSVKSQEAGFYYMHPQNRFWKILSKLLDVNFLSLDIECRKKLLLNHNIALYDSIEECDIEGSSDSKISCTKATNIKELIKNTNIKQIFCNGNASYKYFLKYNPTLANLVTPLPSTSPANAKFSLDDLVEKWIVILDFLGE